MIYGKKKIDLIHADLSFKVRGILFEVHNELGRFCREKQYGDFFEEKLKAAGIAYNRETRISESGNITDFIVDNKIIIELKTKPFLLKADYYQLQRYLHSTQIKLGLLVNFRSEYLNPKRVLLSESVDISKSGSNP